MEDEKNVIPLDGSYGSGPVSELTIITKSGDGEKREVFTFPYVLIDFAKLTVLNNLNLILGYSIVKSERPSALKDLGL